MDKKIYRLVDERALMEARIHRLWLDEFALDFEVQNILHHLLDAEDDEEDGDA